MVGSSNCDIFNQTNVRLNAEQNVSDLIIQENAVAPAEAREEETHGPPARIREYTYPPLFNLSLCIM